MPNKPPTPGITRTLEEGHLAVEKLDLIGQMSYGIFLNQLGSNEYLSEEDMVLNGITEGNLQIRMKIGENREDSGSVPAHGEYQSVDSVLDLIARAPTPEAAASQLVKMFTPGISESAVTSRLMALPGVRDSYNKAVAKAWNAG